MSSGSGFSISPAHASEPTPVTLVMPPTGYIARAFVTNPCGDRARGAWVSVHGHTATPHGLPHGTSFVDWEISSAHPATSGGRVSLILASRQTIGKATTCPGGRSPYAGKPSPATSQPAASGAVTAANSSSTGALAGALAGALLLAAVVALLLRRRRQAR